MFVIYNVIIFYCRQVVTHVVKIKPGAPQIILTVIDIYKKKGVEIQEITFFLIG